MRIFGALLPGSCRVAEVHSLDSRQTRVNSGPVTPVVHGYMLYIHPMVRNIEDLRYDQDIC